MSNSNNPSPQSYEAPGNVGAVVKSTTTTKPKAKTKSAPVRDSWDDDDDDNDSENNDGDGEWNNEAKDPNSATVWRDANTSTPMPALILSNSSSSSSAIPPPEAFAAPMRILQRPKAQSPNSNSSSSAAGSSSTQRSLKEREAEYMAARERIFAVDSGEDVNSQVQQDGMASNKAPDSDSRASVNTPQPTTKTNNKGEKTNAGSTIVPTSSIPSVGVSVIRNPRGPGSTSGGAASRGFGSGKRGAGKGRGGGVGSVKNGES